MKRRKKKGEKNEFVENDEKDIIIKCKKIQQIFIKNNEQ